MEKETIPIINSSLSKRLESTLKLGLTKNLFFGSAKVNQIGSISKQFGIGTISSSSMNLGLTKNLFFGSAKVNQIGSISKQFGIEAISSSSLNLGLTKNLFFGNSKVNQIGSISKQFGIGTISSVNLGLKTVKLFENSALKDMQETSRLIKLKIETLNLDSDNLNTLAFKLFDKQSLSDIEESLILDSEKNEAIEAFFEVFPETKKMKNALSNNEYIKLTIYLLRYIFIYYMTFMGIFNTIDIGESKNYIINGNDVRIRSEPSTEKSNSILIKLYNNHYVKKIEEDGDWFKIEFRNKQNKLITGWVDSNYLIEVED